MVNNKSTTKIFWAGSIGNALDHYDMGLYIFLVPFMAPVFFIQENPTIQIIMGYSLAAVGMVSRPIGALLFGRLAMTQNPKTLLIITLIGVAISTFIIGFIPSYDSIGVWSVLILLLIRITQGIFAAGEQSIASILLLDKIDEKKRTTISSYFVASSMTGAMLASASATIVSMSDNPTYYWRYAFISGIITGLIGIILRYITFDSIKPVQISTTPIYKIFNFHKLALIKVIFISSFSYMTYSIPFVFFNAFIPLFSDITLTQMMHYNTWFLALNIALLPLFGHIAQKYNYKKWMIITVSLLGITAIPAFYLLSKSSIYGITAIKLWFIGIEVAFFTLSKVWMFHLIGSKERYLITGFGYAIGTEILGRQTITICWLLWHLTSNPIAPAFYIIFLSIAAFIALCSKDK